MARIVSGASAKGGSPANQPMTRRPSRNGAVLVLDDQGQEETGPSPGQERRQAFGYRGRHQGDAVGDGASQVGVSVRHRQGHARHRATAAVPVSTSWSRTATTSPSETASACDERASSLLVEPTATRHDARGVEEAEGHDALRHGWPDDSAVGCACLRLAGQDGGLAQDLAVRGWIDVAAAHDHDDVTARGRGSPGAAARPRWAGRRMARPRCEPDGRPRAWRP